MLYILLVLTLLITIRTGWQAYFAYKADRLLKKRFTLFCENAVVTQIEPKLNPASGHMDVALLLNYSIREDGETVRNGKAYWFMPENKLKCGYNVGDVFSIMLCPDENRAIGVDRWMKLLKVGFQNFVIMLFGLSVSIFLCFRLFI